MHDAESTKALTKPLQDLKINLNIFPIDSGDLNWICGFVYQEYINTKMQVEITTLPNRAMQKLLTRAITLLDNATYNFIMDSLNHVESTMKHLIPYKGATIKTGVVEFTNKLAATCANFNKNLPMELSDLMTSLNYGMAPAIDGLINLPGNMVGSLTAQVLNLKMNTLSIILEPIWNTIILPIIEYERWLVAQGLGDKLKRMRQIEDCMRKPGICNRPAKDFIEPKTHKLWSKFYEDDLMIDKQGRIRLSLLIAGQTTEARQQRSRINAVLKRMTSFQTKFH